MSNKKPTYEELEAGLVELEERFQLLDEQFLLGIVILQDSGVKYINEAACRIFEYSAKEIELWDFGGIAGLMHPEDRPFVLEQMKKKQAGESDGVVMHYSARVITKHGKIKWVDQYSKTITYQGKYADLITIIDITDQKHTEIKLKESEQKFKAVFNNTFEFIGILNLDGVLIEANQTALDFGDLKESDVIGKPFWETSWWEHSKEHRDWLRGAISRAASGEFVRGEVNNIDPSGNVHYVDFSIKPVTDIEGNVIFLVPEGRDVTEYKRVEKTMRESEERWRSLTENTKDLIQILDSEGKILYMNRVYPPHKMEDVIGKSVFEFTEEETKEATQRSIDRLVSGLGPQVFETHIRISESIVANFEVKYVPMFSYGKVDKIISLVTDISEKKRSEQALRESEENLRTTLNSIGDAVIATDTSGNITSVNPVAERLTGWRLEEARGRPLTEVFHVTNAKTKEFALNPVSQVLESGEIVGLANHTMLHSKDGREYQISDSAAPIRDVEGVTTGVVLVFRDVTEEYRVREALQESEETFRSIVESSPMGIHMYQLEDDGRLVFMGANSAADRLFNVDNAQFVGKTIEEALPSLVETEIPDRCRRAARDGESWFTEQVSRDNGGITAFSVSVFRMSPGKTAILFNDISDRKKAEERLRHLRNYLANIINSMPSVLIGVDADGMVTQWNTEAQRTTGVSPKEAVGQPLAQAFPRLADEMERVRESMQMREVRSDPRRARKENGETCYEDVTIYPLVSNGVEGAVIRVDNVTRQVRIEELMVQSEKMLSVGGLAAGMAHEINNPLAGMMQNAEVMCNRLTKQRTPANQRAADDAGTSMEAIYAFMESRDIINMLGHIRDSGKRAAEIVANMLSFARKSGSSFSTCDLAKLLDQTVDLAGSDYDLKKKFDFRRIEIVREYEEDLPSVLCEAGKIQQVLLNILRNGAESMQEAREKEKESVTPCFVLRLKSDEEMVQIEVEDNGPGMDEGTRKRVFEPFFTTKPTDQGTGLGLSVSYFIITENHGGEMSVESNSGEGTRFIIRLPTSKGRKP
ncbi:MAG: PAS domain S-box protein [Proteobacteria bacterium]|nr:PAS domain S-box protein [Pseudomonadota bacterium]